ncbi:prepilin-type N-terminal cleavage/methylation domain-containing protein [Patescibacteria group bacterium]|nr:prepilin-type N-terminal cleavage/methylation domain-containing protein [Patescibacteria group bacterium]
MKNRGFTLIEFLIVIAILSMLIMMALSLVPRQLEKARDGERKSDLQKIKIAFEDYYNDNGCYPSATVLQNCGGVSPSSHELSPYLQQIPCDPRDDSYYLYLPFDNSGGAGTCDGFRVWANLEKNDDSVITDLKCDGAIGCGAFEYFALEIGMIAVQYNYGVSEGVPVATGNYAGSVASCCSGVCNVYIFGISSPCADGPYVNWQACIDNSVCTY